MSNFPLWYAPGQNAGTSAPHGWDRLVLGGQTIGAWALVQGQGPRLKFDYKAKAGANAAHPTSHGMDTWVFSVRLAVPDRDWMDMCDGQLVGICPPDNLDAAGKARAFSWDHPQTRTIQRALGRLDVVVENIPLWVPSRAMGRGFECTLELLYWAPGGKTASPLTPASASHTPQYATPNVRNLAVTPSGNPLPTGSAANFSAPVP